MALFRSYPSLLILLTIFINCGSMVPIAGINEAIPDDRLVGVWRAIDSSENESMDCIVYKFNNKEYYMELRKESIDSGKIEKDTLHLRAYVLECENIRFLNVQLIESTKPEERLFFFAKFSFDADTLVELSLVNDMEGTDIDGFSDSKSLYRFIHKNLYDEHLYGDPAKLIKVDHKNHL